MFRMLNSLWHPELDVMRLAEQMNRIEIDWDGKNGFMSYKNVRRYLSHLLVESLFDRADTVYAFHDEKNFVFRTMCNRKLRFVREYDEWYEFPATPGFAYRYILAGLERFTNKKSLDEPEHTFRFRFCEQKRVARWSRLALPDGFVIYLADKRPPLPKDPFLYPELLPKMADEE